MDDMTKKVRALSDDRLAKELVFAGLAAFDRESLRWLNALETEREIRRAK